MIGGVLSGIVFVKRTVLRWRDARSAYGPNKTLCGRWGERANFLGVIEGLTCRHPAQDNYNWSDLHQGEPYGRQLAGQEGDLEFPTGLTKAT